MALFDAKSFKERAKFRLKEVRKHTAYLQKAVNEGDPIAARLAAIRLRVWAEALETMSGEEVQNKMTDLSRTSTS